MKPWLSTIGDQDALNRSGDFWSKMRADVDAAEFWADRIKKFKHDADGRLSLALAQLPLPSAFRECAVALRSIIREKKKNKQNYEEQLAFLYWLAAIDSFLIPYADKLGEPGFNVIESIPGNVILNLDFNYESLGCDNLKLLNATDKKMIIDLWGEPRGHSTLNQLKRSLWNEYEEKLIRLRKKQTF